MLESTVTAKGQTTLPKDVLTALSLKSGDKLRYLVLDGEVRILRAHPVRDLQGALKCQGQTPASLSAMDEAIAERASNSSE